MQRHLRELNRYRSTSTNSIHALSAETTKARAVPAKIRHAVGSSDSVAPVWQAAAWLLRIDRVAVRNARPHGGVGEVVGSVRRILLVSGSLREGSTNSAVLRTARALQPGAVDATLYAGLAALPAFNPDLDDDHLPAAVADLRNAIRASDGVLFSTPEYAGGLPGAFKNLLDWTVGDDRPGSMYEKPVAWLNVAARGAPNAHESLRKVLGYVHATIVESACLAVPVTSAMVDANGLVADETVIRQLVGCLVMLADACPS